MRSNGFVEVGREVSAETGGKGRRDERGRGQGSPGAERLLEARGLTHIQSC